MKKLIALLLAAVIALLSLAACSGEEEGEIMGAQNPYKSTDIVLESENFSYTRAEFSIAFSQYYMDFTYDSETVDFYNLDTEASLKDQIYYDDVTWFDYFADQSLDYMTTVLALCEGAKEKGIELSEDDLATIEETVDSHVRYANDYGYTEEDYFEMLFGKDVGQDALREYYKKEVLALRFEKNEIDSYSFTDDDITKFVEDNREEFYVIDYISYTFDEDDDSNAKASAEALSKITDPAAFDAHILSYMENTLGLKKEQRVTDDCYYKCVYYDEHSDFSKWAFDGAAAGSTYIKANEVDGQYTVYLLTKAPALRQEPTKRLRMITVDVDYHETSVAALEYAEDLLEEWKNGDATEESFAELAKNKSDSTSAAAGGYVEGIAYGDNFPDGAEEWLYSEETTEGSTAIFKEDLIYYILYYIGDGEIKWKFDAQSGLAEEKYNKTKNGLVEKYPAKKHEEIINSLDK